MLKLSLSRGILIALSSAAAMFGVPCNAGNIPTSQLLTTNNTPQLEFEQVESIPIPQHNPAPAHIQKAPTKTQLFSTPIKRRYGGIPVIDVTFNGKQKFEMFLDTGASHTLITQRMARQLKVPVVATTHFRTANGITKLYIGIVKSIQVGGGGTVTNRLVGIAQYDMPLGLLGQDFYSNYDITIKKNVVEFRQRQS